ncbi:MAG TPA: S1C family serine protease [Methylibium sp.]|nr:S1C family serine protease [Methylibium sp.]
MADRWRVKGFGGWCSAVVLALLGPAVPAAEPADEHRALALQRASASVVGLEVKVLPDAPSRETLGALRNGSGVVIGDDGLVLTIGYLLLEAEEVDLRLDNGRLVPARVRALDLATGFGLVQSLLPLDVPAAPLAHDTAVTPDEPLLLVTGGSDGTVSTARLSARQPYSGFWEYHIDQALFTRPTRTDHGGAGLFNGRGELLGIGSLLVLETPAEYENGPGTLFVPVDLLAPIYAELRSRGSSSASHRAWLGVDCVQRPEGVRVQRVVPDSPAADAGVEASDLIRRIDGAPVGDLASFYQRLWSGAVERPVTLELLRDGAAIDLTMRSMDRSQALRRASGI